MTMSRKIRLLQGIAGAAMLCVPMAAQAAPKPAAAALQAQGTFEHLENGIALRKGQMVLRVTAVTDDILRVRIARDGTFPEDASWAVSPEMRKQSIKVSATDTGFATPTMRVRIDPVSGAMTITDSAGKVITADRSDPISMNGTRFTLRKQMPQSEHYFGMGDKTGQLDRRGYSYVDWNTDAFGFSSSADPIYKSIPFFIGVGGEGGSYGIFLDNTWRTWFDFGHREENVLAFGGPDGPIDYYVINGPSTAEVVRRYTDLTGKAPLTPKWGLGYQQSRYSYMSAKEVRDVADRLRKEQIPTDVIWLDIDFQDRNRPFTVNSETFPDLKGLAADMKDEGIKLVAITDLHIAKVDDGSYAPYRTNDRWVRKADGSTYVAPVWPGDSVFPDFTTKQARKWWGGLYREFLDDGIAGFWNDMNEPAIFETPTKTMPLDNIHRIESDDFASRDASHAEIHNVYGMENTRATFEGLKELRPDLRPFVMTRASYAGGQRYSVTWTGDNSSTWDHLKLAVHQLINLGLSGFSYSAADAGGFAGGPSADLLTRWFEIGAFMPIFRDHSAKDTPRAEPWVDGEKHLAIRRRFVNERYRLMPYLYELAERNARTGDPIMRPIFYDYPAAINAPCDQSMVFTMGANLMIAPPPNPESPRSYDVCLPAGGWYDYWTGKPAAGADGAEARARLAAGDVQGQQQGVTRVEETPRIDYLPVFVRAGTILPRQPLVQSTAQTPDGPLSLDIYPGADCKGTIYADDGVTMGYEKGEFFRQQVRCTQAADGSLTIAFDDPQGRYTPWWKEIAVTVHGWSGNGKVLAANAALPVSSDAAAQTLSFTLPADQARGRVQVSLR
ncbi:TIM-barrel domain-containing protein [Stakelama pacifica]|uniref:Alpha-glucosidase n=1 Tax=Stakelama pacifica TaxID=517720 RepID=A0A4R6FYH0_9SPHN|nr:TIM-barrel domain-containing protein [Stakelama pacifica]TDN87022.1 alpha-glucosidase [Stakelama pacifica]GGO91373.1 alpha-glucosidase [Stakelama pacifica]